MPITTIDSFESKVADLPDVPSANMTPDELKAVFDAAPEELRVKLNEVIAKTNSIDTQLSSIIESGSNSNGSYIKYTDGTMICWSNDIDFKTVSTWNNTPYAGNTMYYLNNILWTYPIPFINTNAFVSGSIYGASISVSTLNIKPSTTTNAVYSLNIFGNNPANFSSLTGKLFAIGKWK